MKISIGLMFIIVAVLAEKDPKLERKEKLKKKDISDWDDGDVETVFEEWEDNDEELPDDELPFHHPKKKQQGMGLNIEDMKKKTPEELSRLSQKGKQIMMFVTATTSKRDDTERVTQLWATSLFNANYEVNRYIIEDNRAIFMINDGSLAWEIKDFLVKQNECEEVAIDKETFDGKGKLDRLKREKKEKREKEKKDKEAKKEL